MAKTVIRGILLSFLFGTAAAVPKVTFPINSQVPPVARVSEPFEFQFAPTTFTSSDATNLKYALQNGPSWLALDSSNRTFAGTPSTSDLGSTTFRVTATDSTGATELPVTLVIVDFAGPQQGGNITSQLSRAGPLSDTTSLAIRTGSSFEIIFDLNTFIGATNLSYYATSADRSPLPSWVNFDAATIGFSGSAPPLMSSPQTFGIALFASTVVGFAGASVMFSLVVSNHVLAFEPFEQDVSITEGAAVSFTLLRSQLMLDGQPIATQDLVTATAHMPQWLQFDSTTLDISGKGPSGTISQDVSVTASDNFGNNAKALLHFSSQSVIFKKEIGVLNATIGQKFNYQINRNIFAGPDTTVSINLGSETSWLQFDTRTLTFSGTVPSIAQPTVLNGTVVATSKALAVTETQSFEIRLIEPASVTGLNPTTVQSRGSPSQTTATSSPTMSARQSLDVGNVSKLNNGVIIGIVIVCVVVVLGILFALLYCWKRKREDNGTVRGNRGITISAPHLPGGTWKRDPRSHEVTDQDVEKAGGLSGQDVNVALAPQPNMRSQEPKLNPKRSRYRMSGASVLDHREEFILADSALEAVAVKGHTPHHSMQIPTDIARNPSSVSPTKQRAERLSRLSQRHSGLPVERRRTGLGHGRPTSGSHVRRYGSLMRRHPRDVSSCASDRSGSTGILYDKFPAPALRNFHLHDVLEHDNRASIRVVVDDLPVKDDRPVEEKRQSFIRHRASSKYVNPFHFAGMDPSRESSYSRRAPLGRRSHNSRHLARRLTQRTMSRSSSIGAQMSDGYPRVCGESTQQSVISDDDTRWEDVERESDVGSGSFYSGDDNDQENPAGMSFNVEVEETPSDEGIVARSGRVSHDLRPKSRRRQPLLSVLPNTYTTSRSGGSGETMDSREKRLTSFNTEVASSIKGNIAFL